MSKVYFNLASSVFQQDWSNIGLITANNDWSLVPSIEGFLGQGLTVTTSVNPGTVLTDSASPGDLFVLANQINPTAVFDGGPAEFQLANPTIALQGSSAADAPHIILYLNATGRENITLSFNARDIDGGSDNAVQPIAVQYRIGESGLWTNVPPSGQPMSTPQIADATTGPNLATLVTPITVVLPGEADNQAQLQIRIITTNAFDNDEWVGIDDIAVTSAVLNTPPVLDLDANDSTGGGSDATATFTEDGPAAPIGDVDVAITDSGGTISSATITLSGNRQPDDVLSINGTLPAGITASSYDPGTGIITLTGTASLAGYQTALHQVGYSTPNSNPFTADRIFNVVVSDGTDTSNTASAFIHVVAVNDAPALDLDANNSSGVAGTGYTATFTENGAPVALTDVDVVITDPDNTTITGAFVSFSAAGLMQPGDILAVNGALPAGISAGAFDPVAGTLSLTGSASLADYQTALHQIVFSNSTDNPDTTPRVLAVEVFDSQLGVGLASATINVVAVNDRPVLDLDTNDSSGAAGTDYTTTFTEGGAAVALADLDDLITDLDNATLASATITLGNPQTGDLLSVSGALPAGITATAYDPATGALTLSGVAALADYQTALRQIAFSNASPTPSATDRLVNIVVNDGAANSAPAHTFVHVIPVDTAPALDLDADNSSGPPGAGYTATFTGGSTAVAIADADASIADADSANLVSATITLTNVQAADRLSVNGTLPAGITASSFDPVTGVLTLSGSASLADYQAALRQVEFGSSDPNLPTVTRVIEVVVNDGIKDSNTAFSLIQITVAAPPTLDLDANDSTSSGSDYAATFTEGGAAVPVADTDVALGAATLTSATITLTNPLASDLLSVSGSLPGGIAASAYNPGTGVLTLSGGASAADYQAALQQVVYANGSDDPSTDDRVITVVVNDGVNDSNTATAIVHVAAVSDAPSLSVAAAASYAENDPPVIVSPAATVSDPDSANLTIGIAAITAGLSPGDVLTVGGQRSGAFGALTFNWAAALNVLIVTGAGSLADYDALFRSVQFVSESDDPTNGGADTTRTIAWGVFDGAKTAIATTTLTISAANDAPANAVPATQEIEANTSTAIAGLAVGDVDAGQGMLTTTLSVANGTLTVASAGGAAVSGSGTAAVTLTGTLAQINATLAAAGNVVYRGAQDFFGTDTLTISTADTGNTGSGGALTDIDQVTINLNTYLVGTPNDDSFTALPGNERIDALGSIDTIVFGFALVDAKVTYSGNKVIIDGPTGSHTVLTGFETYVFTDGTVHNYDGNWLVDDLFYYSRNHDVWTAHVEADDHYNTFGWHERRDPDAFFSTTLYLSAYPDVAAAGVNPVTHWHEIGWTEGRVPSLNFGPQEYFAAYPDVAAAGVDPLEHFLQFGHGELREPFPPAKLVAGNGFDYVYYLQNNPDVAAAGVDPFAHFQTSGWKEGRDPNALFDTNGYLSTYTDVAAANVDPLDHYNTSGWHEGRDPSVDFDTTSYLAAYPDIAAAGANPLTHFLQFGKDEGRSAFADGVWG